MFHFLICCSALIWEPCFRSQMWFFLRSNRTDKCGLRYPKIFSLQLCESILTYLLQYRWSHLSIVSIKLCVSMCEGPSQWLKCSFVNLRVKTYLSLKLLLECSVLDEGFLHVSLHVLHPRHMTLALYWYCSVSLDFNSFFNMLFSHWSKWVRCLRITLVFG